MRNGKQGKGIVDAGVGVDEYVANDHCPVLSPRSAIQSDSNALVRSLTESAALAPVPFQ